MLLLPGYKPEFDSLRDRLIEMAQIRHIGELLQRVVAFLAERPHVALARIWLLDRGDQCDHCALRDRCHHRSFCLHIVASSGHRRGAHFPDWSRLDDEFQRIPLGEGKIGRVGAGGQEIVIRDFLENSTFLEKYPWATEQQVQGFNAQPIRFKEEVLGVIALFTYIPTPEEGPAWLRIVADQIAGGIVQARAFEELERLRSQLESENPGLRQEIRESEISGEMIGQSAVFMDLRRQIERVAPTDASVLILGESGTGKELVARELHRRSTRADRPLIKVNCASVPRELYESEFFGHIKGAFTGAIKNRAGRFEAAEGGTLFLDEVGDIPFELQSKFLRVLQERQYERVGEERTRTVDVRVIAATNHDLVREVAEGRFREDLFYRLNVFPIQVPALRDRLEDIPFLAEHFLQQAARRLRVPVPKLNNTHVRILQSRSWRGNVRELHNEVERAVILAEQGNLQFRFPGCDTEHGQRADSPKLADPEIILTEAELREREKQNLVSALTAANWKIHGPGGAAERLALKPTTLVSRLKAFGLKRPTETTTAVGI